MKTDGLVVSFVLKPQSVVRLQRFTKEKGMTMDRVINDLISMLCLNDDYRIESEKKHDFKNIRNI